MRLDGGSHWGRYIPSVSRCAFTEGRNLAVYWEESEVCIMCFQNVKQWKSTEHVHSNCVIAILCITNCLPDDDPVGLKHVGVCDLNSEY
jgi:hypothetical protein